MGASEIVKRIMEDAREEQARILREAREQVEEQLKRARADIEARKKQYIDAERARAAENKERIIRSKRLAAKKLRWDMEEQMIKRVFEESLKRLPQIKESGFKGSTYSDILAGLIKEAVMSITGGTGNEELEVLLSADDAGFVTDEILDTIARGIGDGVRISISEERLKTAGGAIVRRTDGKIEVNNTFEERMKRLSSELRERVARTLFHGEA